MECPILIPAPFLHFYSCFGEYMYYPCFCIMECKLVYKKHQQLYIDNTVVLAFWLRETVVLEPLYTVHSKRFCNLYGFSYIECYCTLYYWHTEKRLLQSNYVSTIGKQKSITNDCNLCNNQAKVQNTYAILFIHTKPQAQILTAIVLIHRQTHLMYTAGEGAFTFSFISTHSFSYLFLRPISCAIAELASTNYREALSQNTLCHTCAHIAHQMATHTK